MWWMSVLRRSRDMTPRQRWNSWTTYNLLCFTHLTRMWEWLDVQEVLIAFFLIIICYCDHKWLFYSLPPRYPAWTQCGCHGQMSPSAKAERADANLGILTTCSHAVAWTLWQHSPSQRSCAPLWRAWCYRPRFTALRARWPSPSSISPTCTCRHKALLHWCSDGKFLSFTIFQAVDFLSQVLDSPDCAAINDAVRILQEIGEVAGFLTSNILNFNFKYYCSFINIVVF